MEYFDFSTLLPYVRSSTFEFRPQPILSRPPLMKLQPIINLLNTFYSWPNLSPVTFEPESNRPRDTVPLRIARHILNLHHKHSPQQGDRRWRAEPGKGEGRMVFEPYLRSPSRGRSPRRGRSSQRGHSPRKGKLVEVFQRSTFQRSNVQRSDVPTFQRSTFDRDPLAPYETSQRRVACPTSPHSRMRTQPAAAPPPPSAG